MELLAKHVVLAAGESCDECRTQVMNFFERTSLVRYDEIRIADDCLCGTVSRFGTTLEQALGRNREILSGFIDELGNSGFEFRTELAAVPQGYPSKVLHIIAHFLDGFIGIDSAFYNLVDDSHWLSAETRSKITDEPERFWLFSLACYSLSPKEAALLHQ